MIALIQKSGQSSVVVEGKTVGEISSGLVVLLGIANTDNENDINTLVEKVINLRIFENDDKHFNISLLESKKELLLISQFTLQANCTKGRRPDFQNAAKAELAKPLYEKFIEKLEENGIKVRTGVFGAMMEVKITNQGPVTIILDTKQNL